MEEARFCFMFYGFLLLAIVTVAFFGDFIAGYGEMEYNVLTVSDYEFIQNMARGLFATSKICKGILNAMSFALVPFLVLYIPCALACIFEGKIEAKERQYKD